MLTEFFWRNIVTITPGGCFQITTYLQRCCENKFLSAIIHIFMGLIFIQIVLRKINDNLKMVYWTKNMDQFGVDWKSSLCGEVRVCLSVVEVLLFLPFSKKQWRKNWKCFVLHEYFWKNSTCLERNFWETLSWLLSSEIWTTKLKTNGFWDCASNHLFKLDKLNFSRPRHTMRQVAETHHGDNCPRLHWCCNKLLQ